MKQKSIEVFIPGPAGRLEERYFKNQKQNLQLQLFFSHTHNTSVTMNNRVIVEIFNAFIENGFSVLRLNFRGVGKSDGSFDNGQGELSDASSVRLNWKRKFRF